MTKLTLDFLKESFSTIDKKWQQLLHMPEFSSILNRIDIKLTELSQKSTIFPPKNCIFDAFRYTKFNQLAVVIVGQDPYHGDSEANGLAFAVNSGIKQPPSLKNILLELTKEYNISIENIKANLLESWALQGVLLLNSTLTVIKDSPNSLNSIGWNLITDGIIKYISDNKSGVVFTLWGNFARKKSNLINSRKHLILESSHPSPLSVYRGFLGCNHFITTNEYLTKLKKPAINWI